MCVCVCVPTFPCVRQTLTSFVVVCFILFWLGVFPVCFLKREKRGSGTWLVGFKEDQGGDEGRQTMITTYRMRKCIYKSHPDEPIHKDRLWLDFSLPVVIDISYLLPYS